MNRSSARRLSILVATALLAAAGTASAQAPDCKNAMTTLEMNACAAADEKVVEAKLNEVYQRVLKSYGDQEHAAARSKLIAAQRAWVKFREADCDAVLEKWAGGSIRTQMYIGCMQNHAERRIKDLEDFGTNY
jgi:uncharacterized protein YecT (DUF1311 family)